jgi:hypothetical protein
MSYDIVGFQDYTDFIILSHHKDNTKILIDQTYNKKKRDGIPSNEVSPDDAVYELKDIFLQPINLNPRLLIHNIIHNILTLC